MAVLEDLSLPELRALVYKYATKLLDYPYDEDVEKLGALLEDLAGILKGLERLCEAYAGLAEEALKAKELMEEELKRLGRDMFQAEYVSTFELGVRGPLCPPYESEYVKPGGPRTVKLAAPRIGGGEREVKALEEKLEVMNRVLEFYNEYGVSVKNMLPDHLVVELEFMYYLVHRECEALRRGDEKEVARYREAQLRFLGEHLLRWVGRLAECVEEKGALKSYAKLLKLVAEFMARDYEQGRGSS